MNTSDEWGAALVPIAQLAGENFLASPDSGAPLYFDGSDMTLRAAGESFPVEADNAILYPNRVREAWIGGRLAPEEFEDSLLQYCLLSQFKQVGETNAPAESPSVALHLERMSYVTAGLQGRLLDIGSGDPAVSAQFFPSSCEYVGLDPYGRHPNGITAMAELLPFSDGSFDVCVFNTSLDHILDYRTALAEARRVLRPGGVIVISTLIWSAEATLLTDTVHFHHFRESDLHAALGPTLTKLFRYPDPKGLPHRNGLYIVAEV